MFYATETSQAYLIVLRARKELCLTNVLRSRNESGLTRNVLRAQIELRLTNNDSRDQTRYA